jgi:hypothetical protein
VTGVVLRNAAVVLTIPLIRGFCPDLFVELMEEDMDILTVM